MVGKERRTSELVAKVNDNAGGIPNAGSAADELQLTSRAAGVAAVDEVHDQARGNNPCCADSEQPASGVKPDEREVE